ncbi:MAG: thioredoxin family protein, partial [Alphaproteobacteria bacterium]|nr:thioredoxin family protein [Alphaproteobacteria bacterium]
ETLERLRKISTLLIFGFAAVCVSGISVYAEKTHLQNMIKYAQTHKTAIDKTLIAEKLAEGKPVLLEIGADWCLTCRYNGAVTLNDFNLQRWKEMYQLEFIRVDWTNYNKEVLDFMEKYGRKGLPFYILYTPLLRDGFVLPEMFKRDDFESMLLSAMTR